MPSRIGQVLFLLYLEDVEGAAVVLLNEGGGEAAGLGSDPASGPGGECFADGTEALAIGAVGECAGRAAVYLDAEDNAGDGDTAAGGGLQVFGTEEEDTGGLCLGGSGVGSLRPRRAGSGQRSSRP